MTLDILVIDANDNTPTFAQVSYSVEVFTNMLPGETVLQVSTRDVLLILFHAAEKKSSPRPLRTIYESFIRGELFLESYKCNVLRVKAAQKCLFH